MLVSLGVSPVEALAESLQADSTFASSSTQWFVAAHGEHLGHGMVDALAWVGFVGNTT